MQISKKENEKINIKLGKKEDKFKKLRAKEANENITKEKKHIETQLLEVQGNLVRSSGPISEI